ncbi:MAG: hypothetical protein K8R11_02575 [Methanococcoides sp.]|nr:hypothetical protein [Methanococcoides sp.]
MKQRMRVFAGPNGSGKTAIVSEFIEKRDELIDPTRHINPDELNLLDVLNFDNFGVKVDEGDFRDFVLKYHFYEKLGITIQDLKIKDNCFYITKKSSYMGAMLSDYLRQCLIKTNERLFSFETVLSHPSKIDFLKDAKELDWDVYLYFVSTNDPEINCVRVAQRVQMGGHDVPREKIYDRYTKANNNLFEALKHCRRAYIFDNSEEMELIAKKNPDGSLDLLVDYLTSGWFNECVLSKLNK